MTSRYYTIDETLGQSHQTGALQAKDVRRVAHVVEYILEHFVDRAEWQEMIVWKGSITLQHVRDPHQVIKVFVDHEFKLWNKLGFDCPPPVLNVDDGLVMVGCELGSHGPFERQAVRNALANDFDLYADPRNGKHAKWWLKPIREHVYDIVVLTPGECLEISEQAVNERAERIIVALPSAKEDEV